MEEGAMERLQESGSVRRSSLVSMAPLRWKRKTLPDTAHAHSAPNYFLT